MRGIFFDEDDARAAVRLLEAEGWTTQLSRERLAGEDDDEGHPWAVVTDAPEIVLEVLVDRFEGWLDTDDPDPAAAVAPLRPLDLPSAPRTRTTGRTNDRRSGVARHDPPPPTPKAGP